MLTSENIATKLEQWSRHGKYYRACCPFHNDSEPSLLIFEDGAWCLGCQRHFTLRQLEQKKSYYAKPLSVKGMPDWSELLPKAEELVYEANDTLTKYPFLGLYLKETLLAAGNPVLIVMKNGWAQSVSQPIGMATKKKAAPAKKTVKGKLR